MYILNVNLLKKKIENGLVKLIHLKNENQLADIFTKPLTKVKFLKFVNELGLLVYKLVVLKNVTVLVSKNI